MGNYTQYFVITSKGKEFEKEYIYIWTFLVAQMIKDLPVMLETRVQSLGPKGPWRMEWNPLQYFCVENSMDRGAWQGVERVRHN